MAQAQSPLKLLSAIKHEIRSINKPKKKSSGDLSLRHLIDIFRQNQVTEKRFCRPKEHYKYLGEAYLTYLKSTRAQSELIQKYYSRSEKTIEESAKIVGLALPKAPK